MRSESVRSGILRAYRGGEMGVQEIAEEFGVSRWSVRAVINAAQPPARPA